MHIIFIYRELKSDDVLECRVEVCFDVDLLKQQKRIPYKYCVMNSNRKDDFEFLHAAPGPRIRNRSLLVPQKEILIQPGKS